MSMVRKNFDYSEALEQKVKDYKKKCKHKDYIYYVHRYILATGGYKVCKS